MRYFFDIQDGGTVFDDTGIELADSEAVRHHAMSALPAIAAEEVPHGKDRQNFTMLVTNETGAPIYSATLSYVGLWLDRRNSD